MMPRLTRSGFTLLELAIVLGVLALIAGVGMKMAGGSLKAADRVTTQERLAAVKTALDSFAKTYGYLPCPADRAMLTTNVNFGLEQRSVVTRTTCVASAPGLVSNVYGWFGAVPVRTLGLPDYYAADAWGNKLTYAVSDQLKSGPHMYDSMTQNNLAVRYGNRTNWYFQTLGSVSLSFGPVANNGSGAARVTVPGSAPATGTLVHMAGSVYKGSYVVTNISATQFDLNSSTYTVTDTGTLEWQEPGTNAAYVVVSHGPDGRGAFPLAGTAIPGNKLCNSSATANTSPAPCTSSATTSCIDIENCNDDYIFYDTAYNDGTQATSYFDDYVVWGSNALQRSPISNNLYTSCPTGVCEAWCAACGYNYPGATSSHPSAATIPVGPYVYKKMLNTNSASCTATCFWGGRTVFLTAACPSGNCYISAP